MTGRDAEPAAPSSGRPGARLRPDQLERYSRHLLLPGFGATQQRALAAARVLVVGAGGLGSASIPYLVAAGVGRMVVVDDDVVELSNLQRQTLHRAVDLGRPKAASAARWAADLNPDVVIDARRERLDAANVRAMVRDADLVLDGTDNFTTRYLVADACWFERRPLCHAAVFRWEGQATTFLPQGEASPTTTATTTAAPAEPAPAPATAPEPAPAEAARAAADAPSARPCYRCLYPEPPPAGAVPSCAEAGVLGAVVGAVGVVQAIEALKVLTGLGDPLVGRLMLFDAFGMSWRTIRYRRAADCPLCGSSPTIRDVAPIDASVDACALAPPPAPTP